jgi:hypothetical protein
LSTSPARLGRVRASCPLAVHGYVSNPYPAGLSHFRDREIPGVWVTPSAMASMPSTSMWSVPTSRRQASVRLAAILREAHALEERTFGAAEQAARQIRAAAGQAPYRGPNVVQQGLDQLPTRLGEHQGVGRQACRGPAHDFGRPQRDRRRGCRGRVGHTSRPGSRSDRQHDPADRRRHHGGLRLGIDVLLKLSTRSAGLALPGVARTIP